MSKIKTIEMLEAMSSKERVPYQKQNCRYLARQLRRKIVEEHYNHNYVYRHLGNHEQPDADPFDCDTTACAWGHAATMPYFNRRGLCYVRSGSRDQTHQYTPNYDYISPESILLFGAGYICFDAIANHSKYLSPLANASEVADAFEAAANKM